MYGYIETNPKAAQVATEEGVNVICGDIEEPLLLFSIHEKFDVILLMDVVEHLTKPVNTLIQLKQRVNPGGKIITTDPNVAYWAIRKNLLFGQWNYADSGIMDKTHLHFYTASTWKALMEEAGYRVTSLKPVEGMVPFENFLFKSELLKESVGWLRHLAITAAPELFTIVYLLEAIPT
ncbi:methyltransferase domain-containing protein [Egbenema bharatensis]|uniref:methyltransferase domain-containing protein n=1 Tax=Egbenema bharatensis TaxID=3463334 RepID=UPI003A8A2F9B